MDATELLPIIAVFSLVTVEFGGHVLLRFITVDRETLTPLRERFFSLFLRRSPGLLQVREESHP
jgi:hypothetical protein